MKKKSSVKNDNLFISKSLLQSDPFKKLPKAATNLYFAFLMKRQLQPVGKPGHEKWVIKNNGDIVFTYSMGWDELRMYSPAFRRAIDHLVNYGFIDIHYHGSGGVKGDCSKYGISNRWRQYGSEQFDQKPRPKDLRPIGFRRNNKANPK